MDLGKNIYRLRSEKNMSQGDLADALEVSRQSVSKWENNSAVPELEKLVKMAELFKVTLDELVGKKTAEKTNPEPMQTVYPPVEITRPPVPVLTYVGIALLCCSIISLILFLIFGEEHWFLYDCIFYVSIPLGIISALCLVSDKKHRKHLLLSIAALIGIIIAAWLIIHAPPLMEHVFTGAEETPVQSISPDGSETTAPD